MNILNTLPTLLLPYEYLYHDLINKRTNRLISLFVCQIIGGLFVCLLGSKQTMFVKLLVYWTPYWFPTLDFMLSIVDDFKKEFQTEADADRTFDYLA